MKTLKVFWKKLSQTKALESSGKLEVLFFESVYRVKYVLGLSSSDPGFYILYSTAVKLSSLMLFVAEVSHMLMDSVDFDDIAASLNVTVLQMITFYRYYNMFIHRDLYDQLAASMQSKTFDISTEKRKKIVEYWSDVNDNYLKLLLVIGNLTLIVWVVYPLVDNIDYNMVVPLKLPYNYRNPRDYAIAYIIIWVVFYYVAHFVMAADLWMQTHFLHLVCQFNVLADCFENIVEDCCNDTKGDVIKYSNAESEKNFGKKYKNRLSGLVEQHKFLLRLALELRSSLSRPMLGHLAASSILICFIAYQAATTITENITKCLMSLFFLGYNLFGFYVICRWCEEIKTQSESISTAVYCSHWERGVAVLPTVRSSLMLLIARANKPVVMTAGGMYDLSLMSYSSLVKTSYTALTVLLRFRK